MKRLGYGNSNNIMSFIGMAVFVILFITAFIFLSYLFVIIAVFGLIFVLIVYIRMRFFKKPLLPGNFFINGTIIEEHEKIKGRIIDQDDKKHHPHEHKDSESRRPPT